MINTGLKEYEREVVEPRHRETQSELAAIKQIVQQGRGAIWALGIIFTVVMAGFEAWRTFHK